MATTELSSAAAPGPFIGTCGGSLEVLPTSAFGAPVIREAGSTGTCRIVASKRDGGAWPPLGRDLHRG